MEGYPIEPWRCVFKAISVRYSNDGIVWAGLQHQPRTREFSCHAFESVYSDADMEAHNRFKDLRNEVYAHTDSQHHHVTSYHAEIDGGVVITDMTGKPIHRLEREEVEKLVGMSLRMLDAIHTVKTGMKVTQLKKQISK